MIRRFVKCISTTVTLIAMVCCLHSPSKAQIGTTHFCDVNIDTVTDSLIQNALLYGTAQDVTNLIDTGKKQIDTAVGCGKAGYAYFPTPYDTPTFILIINDWYQFHAFNHLSQIATSCPGTGRVEGSMALGGFFARLAGLYVNLDTLNYPPLNAIQEQYDSTHVTPPLLYPSGVYGYYNMAAPNPCNIIGLTDNDISNHYVNPTSYAVIYNNGAYAGDSLVVRDYDPSTNWYFAGLQYDNAWLVTMMRYASNDTGNAKYKTAYINSALEVAKWELQEPLVVNYEENAAGIWLLAEMYDWFGDTNYRNSMMDRLNRGLLPAILMDMNHDGIVDGMVNKPFDSLTLLARVPGRMWDPGNAVYWNTGRCLNGLVEAYVALRDRGDTADASMIKPYMMAMMNNICWQVNHQGSFSLDTRYRDLDYAVANAVWKVERYEKLIYPSWDSTLWCLYNGGVAKHTGQTTVNVAMRLLLSLDIPYQSITGIAEPPVSFIDRTMVYPNPSDGSSTLSFYVEQPAQIDITLTDIMGRTVAKVADRQFLSGRQIISLDYRNLPLGIYLIRLQGAKQSRVIKWVKNN